MTIKIAPQSCLPAALVHCLLFRRAAAIAAGAGNKIVRPSLIALAALAAAGPADVQAGSKEFIGTGTTPTELSDPTNYNPTGLPASTDNIVFDSGSTVSTSLSLTATTLNVEDLSFSTATTATIANTTTTTTASTLELNGGLGSAVPLIDQASTKTLTFKNGTTGALNLLLGASGNFEIDSSGGLTISSNIGQVSTGASLTITAGTLAGATAPGTGTVTLSGTNSFSGGLVAAGTEVDVTSDASLGAVGGSVTINGGRLGFATNNTTIDPTRPFYLGANPMGLNTAGTLSIKGTITVTENGVIQNMPSGTGTVSPGDLVKQGGGTLQLGGANTYTGNTFLNNGTTQLINGNNRLPTSTTLALGQSASTNVGKLDLDGNNQQIAGLNSIAGAAETAKNTLTTSTGSSTLTLGGSGTYAYGDGTVANSGVITGAVSVAKIGTGTQTFGDANTYSGGTTVSGGILVAGTATSGSAVQALGGTSGVMINGGGTLQMGAANQFNTTTPAPLTFSGTTAAAATFNVNGNSQGSTTANGVGLLTLVAGSSKNIINFGSTAGVVTFAGLTLNGATLTISNYLNNNGASGGPDELIFNQSVSTVNLPSIVFTGYGAATEAELGTSSFYEVYPASVPEPSTAAWLGVCGFAGILLGCRVRHRAA